MVTLVRGSQFVTKRRLASVLIAVVTLIVRMALAQDGSEATQLSRAVELHQSSHYAEAISAYRAYLKVHPDAAAVRSNLGAALSHEGYYDDAIREYKQALAVQPTNNGIRFNLALAYYKSSDIEKAVHEFEAVYSGLA